MLDSTDFKILIQEPTACSQDPKVYYLAMGYWQLVFASDSIKNLGVLKIKT